MGRLSGVIPFILALAVSLFAFAFPLGAQTTFPTVFPKAILILDQERLFSDSVLGQQMLQVVIDKREALIKENRGIDSAFESEELRLTEQRAELPTDEFQALADDFDARVQKAREEQLQKSRDLQDEYDIAPRRFLEIATPYLQQLMQKYSAGALLDRRSVLLFDRNSDITDEAIKLLDQAIAENPDIAAKDIPNE